MKLANGFFAITLAAVFSGLPAKAQPAAAPAKPEMQVRTFYLNNTVQGSDDGREILNALRFTLDEHDGPYLDSSQNAIVIHATNPGDFALAQKVIDDLDRLKKTYRLTYTVTEMDGTKRVGVQHFAMNLIPGQRTTLNESSKVPIATGSYQGGSGPVQTNFTYIDVGMTFDATVTELGKGVRLQSKVTQASAAAPDESSTEGKVSAAGQPVRRDTSLEGASFLTLGKPMVLGSMDLPGSTRHLEVEVLMEEAVR